VKAGVSATPADQSIYVVHAGAVPRPAPPPTGGFNDVLPGCAQATRIAEGAVSDHNPKGGRKIPSRPLGGRLTR